MKIDEAKLTAYLLGEISDLELSDAIEKELKSNPQLRQRAEEIKKLEAGLRNAFEDEHFSPSEFPGIPSSLPQLNADEDVSTMTHWLPWVAGLAASFVIVCSFLLLDIGESNPDGSAFVSTSVSSSPGTIPLEDFDLSLIRSELLGEGATWSDSQVLAGSLFYKKAVQEMALSPGRKNRTDWVPIAPGQSLERDFSKAFNQPYSEVPIHWDGFGMTRVELALGRGTLPAPESVEVDALVNAIPYDYEAPVELDEPFAVHMEQSESPWQEGQTLLRVGLQGYGKPVELPSQNNFVFLVDVSGSMDEPYKLPLVKEGLKYVAERMTPRDRIAIVTYGGSSDVHLPSTFGLDRVRILEGIEALAPGIGTDSDSAVLEAYRIASDAYMEDGSNRVIVCTDGDIQLGVGDAQQLNWTIETWTERDITLSAYGFAMGPGRHAGFENLASLGEGEFGYVDSPMDVNRSFAGRLTGEVASIASDVRLEVEFNPEKVDAYRLIGYEEQAPKENHLAFSRPSQLDVSVGHSLTALYELIPNEIREDPKSKGSEIASQFGGQDEDIVEELVTVRVHYQPEGRTQEELIEVLFSGEASPFEDASNDMRFAAAVTGFGQILRNSPHKGDVDFNWVLATAGGAIGNNSGGMRTQFLEVVRQAEAITNTDYSASEK